MRLQWECVDAANCAFRPVGCLAPRSRYSKITSLHRGSKSAVHGEKKSGCKGNERGSPSLDPNPPRSLLSLLPETASLSPTAAKTVKHHTASMIFTYSPGLQHGEPQDVTNPADGVKKRLKKSHKWWRGSKINLLNIWRRASSHLSPSLSLALSAPVNTATENLDLHIRMMKKRSDRPVSEMMDTGLESDQWRNSVERESAHRGIIAPQACAGAYGCMDEVVCVCICESAVCGNEGMGNRRAMRWVCGEEDTWDAGTLLHPEQPPPPVAMQLCARRGCDSPPAGEKLERGSGMGSSFIFWTWRS